MTQIYPFVLNPLPYAYDASEPFLDKETMMLHHDKHHQAYVDKLNAGLAKSPSTQNKSLEELLKNLKSLPQDLQAPVRKFGGGHFNHEFFWSILKKDVKPRPEISEAINIQFTSIDKFKEEFALKATSLFGSGWTWLVFAQGKLEILNTANQDTPLEQGKTPLIALDLWEHAYYLKYQHRRPEFIAAFFNVINWEEVNEKFLKLK